MNEVIYITLKSLVANVDDLTIKVVMVLDWILKMGVFVCSS